MSTQSFSTDIENFLDLTKKKYVEFNIDLKQAHLNGISIYSFFIALNEEGLKSSWTKINSWIGGNFQPLLESEFEKWNLYLFFSLPTKINLSLKYTVENDTFSSRKIVIESTQDYDEIINEHIINTDLKFDVPNDKSENQDFEKDPDLEKVLSNESIRGKKNKQSAKPVFEALYKTLKSKADEN